MSVRYSLTASWGAQAQARQNDPADRFEVMRRSRLFSMSKCDWKKRRRTFNPWLSAVK